MTGRTLSSSSDGRSVACILLFLREICDRSPPAILSMPTYEYSCEKSGGTVEIVQSMRDAALKECPKERCQQKKWGHGKVKRLIGTGAGLIFNGSGFYITDYRSDSYREAAKKDAPAPPDKPAAKEGNTAPAEAAPAKPE